MAITLAEIAKLAEVSKTTVSFVLNGDGKRRGIKDETIRRVQEIAEKHGYIPNQAARFFRKGKQHLFALVAPNVTDGFYAEIAQGIEQSAEKLGYQILFGSTFNDVDRERRYLESLVARRVDGIILLPNNIQEKHLNLVRAHKIPTILFRRRNGSKKQFKFITFDDKMSSYIAARHLIEQGCKNLAFIAEEPGQHHEWLRIIYEARLEGLERALKEAGQTFNKEKVLLLPDEELDSGTLQRMVKKHKIDGFVGSEDMLSLRVMNVLKDLGYRIPEDIRIIGCDNSNYSRFLSPPLSSVDFPRHQLGQVMVEELVQMIESEEQSLGEILLAPQLVVRGSSL